LKRQKTLPEKDAKSVFMQIMSGLRYLNRPLAYGSSSSSSSSSTAASLDHDNHEDNDQHHHHHHNNKNNKFSKRKLSIIHFDLKPGNVTSLYVINDDVVLMMILTTLMIVINSHDHDH
jgi:serine/threonine protein kinase